ncbi:MAG TPA: hypothetical protein VGC39_09385 [Candidatus Methylacidiphilales bacterium]
MILLALVFPALPGKADEIKRKHGKVITGGQIVKVADGKVIVNINGGTVPYYLSDIQSVTMPPPAAMANMKDPTPATAAAILDPLVKQYAGLPADWVVDAMVQLAQADDALGKSDLATNLYNQIDQLYPGSPYLIQAVAGKAKSSLQHGKVDEAIAALQPLIDKANQNVAPSPSDGRLYANAFLVYGQALEAQKKFSQALEAYLTVKTMFYQNSTLAQQADQLAGKLRQENPGLGVD